MDDDQEDLVEGQDRTAAQVAADMKAVAEHTPVLAPLPEISVEDGKLVIKESTPMADGTVRTFGFTAPEALDLTGILETESSQEKPDGEEEASG